MINTQVSPGKSHLILNFTMTGWKLLCTVLIFTELFQILKLNFWKKITGISYRTVPSKIGPIFFECLKFRRVISEAFTRVK